MSFTNLRLFPFIPSLLRIFIDIDVGIFFANIIILMFKACFPGGSDGKESACNAGHWGSIPGLGRSPGGGNGNHSSILAWRIPWTEELVRLQSMESQRFGHDWATELNWTELKELWTWMQPTSAFSLHNWPLHTLLLNGKNSSISFPPPFMVF